MPASDAVHGDVAATAASLTVDEGRKLFIAMCNYAALGQFELARAILRRLSRGSPLLAASALDVMVLHGPPRSWVPSVSVPSSAHLSWLAHTTRKELPQWIPPHRLPHFRRVDNASVPRWLLARIEFDQLLVTAIADGAALAAPSLSADVADELRVLHFRCLDRSAVPHAMVCDARALFRRPSGDPLPEERPEGDEEEEEEEEEGAAAPHVRCTSASELCTALPPLSLLPTPGFLPASISALPARRVHVGLPGPSPPGAGAGTSRAHRGRRGTEPDTSAGTVPASAPLQLSAKACGQLRHLVLVQPATGGALWLRLAKRLSRDSPARQALLRLLVRSCAEALLAGQHNVTAWLFQLLRPFEDDPSLDSLFAATADVLWDAETAALAGGAERGAGSSGARIPSALLAARLRAMRGEPSGAPSAGEEGGDGGGSVAYHQAGSQFLLAARPVSVTTRGTSSSSSPSAHDGALFVSLVEALVSTGSGRLLARFAAVLDAQTRAHARFVNELPPHVWAYRCAAGLRHPGTMPAMAQAALAANAAAGSLPLAGTRHWRTFCAEHATNALSRGRHLLGGVMDAALEALRDKAFSRASALLEPFPPLRALVMLAARGELDDDADTLMRLVVSLWNRGGGEAGADRARRAIAHLTAHDGRSRPSSENRDVWSALAHRCAHTAGSIEFVDRFDSAEPRFERMCDNLAFDLRLALWVARQQSGAHRDTQDADRALEEDARTHGVHPALVDRLRRLATATTTDTASTGDGGAANASDGLDAVSCAMGDAELLLDGASEEELGAATGLVRGMQRGSVLGVLREALPSLPGEAFLSFLLLRPRGTLAQTLAHARDVDLVRASLALRALLGAVARDIGLASPDVDAPASEQGPGTPDGPPDARPDATLTAAVGRAASHLNAIGSPASRIAALEACFALLFLRRRHLGSVARDAGRSRTAAASGAPSQDAFLATPRLVRALLRMLHGALRRLADLLVERSAAWKEAAGQLPTEEQASAPAASSPEPAASAAGDYSLPSSDEGALREVVAAREATEESEVRARVYSLAQCVMDGRERLRAVLVTMRAVAPLGGSGGGGGEAAADADAGTARPGAGAVPGSLQGRHGRVEGEEDSRGFGAGAGSSPRHDGEGEQAGDAGGREEGGDEGEEEDDRPEWTFLDRMLSPPATLMRDCLVAGRYTLAFRLIRFFGMARRTALRVAADDELARAARQLEAIGADASVDVAFTDRVQRLAVASAALGAPSAGEGPETTVPGSAVLGSAADVLRREEEGDWDSPGGTWADVADSPLLCALRDAPVEDGGEQQQSLQLPRRARIFRPLAFPALPSETAAAASAPPLLAAYACIDLGVCVASAAEHSSALLDRAKALLGEWAASDPSTPSAYAPALGDDAVQSLHDLIAGAAASFVRLIEANRAARRQAPPLRVLLGNVEALPMERTLLETHIARMQSKNQALLALREVLADLKGGSGGPASARGGASRSAGLQQQQQQQQQQAPLDALLNSVISTFNADGAADGEEGEGEDEGEEKVVEAGRRGERGHRQGPSGDSGADTSAAEGTPASPKGDGTPTPTLRSGVAAQRLQYLLPFLRHVVRMGNLLRQAGWEDADLTLLSKSPRRILAELVFLLGGIDQARALASSVHVDLLSVLLRNSAPALGAEGPAPGTGARDEERVSCPITVDVARVLQSLEATRPLPQLEGEPALLTSLFCLTRRPSRGSIDPELIRIGVSLSRPFPTLHRWALARAQSYQVLASVFAASDSGDVGVGASSLSPRHFLEFGESDFRLRDVPHLGEGGIEALRALHGSQSRSVSAAFDAVVRRLRELGRAEDALVLSDSALPPGTSLVESLLDELARDPHRAEQAPEYLLRMRQPERATQLALELHRSWGIGVALRTLRQCAAPLPPDSALRHRAEQTRSRLRVVNAVLSSEPGLWGDWVQLSTACDEDPVAVIRQLVSRNRHELALRVMELPRTSEQASAVAEALRLEVEESLCLHLLTAPPAVVGRDSHARAVQRLRQLGGDSAAVALRLVDSVGEERLALLLVRFLLGFPTAHARLPLTQRFSSPGLADASGAEVEVTLERLRVWALSLRILLRLPRQWRARLRHLRSQPRVIVHTLVLAGAVDAVAGAIEEASELVSDTLLAWAAERALRFRSDAPPAADRPTPGDAPCSPLQGRVPHAPRATLSSRLAAKRRARKSRSRRMGSRGHARSLDGAAASGDDLPASLILTGSAEEDAARCEEHVYSDAPSLSLARGLLSLASSPRVAGLLCLHLCDILSRDLAPSTPRTPDRGALAASAIQGLLSSAGEHFVRASAQEGACPVTPSPTPSAGRGAAEGAAAQHGIPVPHAFAALAHTAPSSALADKAAALAKCVPLLRALHAMAAAQGGPCQQFAVPLSHLADAAKAAALRDALLAREVDRVDMAHALATTCNVAAEHTDAAAALVAFGQGDFETGRSRLRRAVRGLSRAGAHALARDVASTLMPSGPWPRRAEAHSTHTASTHGPRDSDHTRTHTASGGGGGSGGSNSSSVGGGVDTTIGSGHGFTQSAVPWAAARSGLKHGTLRGLRAYTALLSARLLDRFASLPSEAEHGDDALDRSTLPPVDDPELVGCPPPCELALLPPTMAGALQRKSEQEDGDGDGGGDSGSEDGSEATGDAPSGDAQVIAALPARQLAQGAAEECRRVLDAHGAPRDLVSFLAWRGDTEGAMAATLRRQLPVRDFVEVVAESCLAHGRLGEMTAVVVRDAGPGGRESVAWTPYLDGIGRHLASQGSLRLLYRLLVFRRWLSAAAVSCEALFLGASDFDTRMGLLQNAKNHYTAAIASSEPPQAKESGPAPNAAVEEGEEQTHGLLAAGSDQLWPALRAWLQCPVPILRARLRLIEMQASICQQLPNPPTQFPPSRVLGTAASAGAMATLTEHLEGASEGDAAPWQQESLPLHAAPPPSSLCILRTAEADDESVAARRFAVARVLTARRFDTGRRLAQYFRLPMLQLYVCCLVDAARSGEGDGAARLRSLLDGVRRVVSDRQWGKVIFSVLDHLGPDLAVPYVRNAFEAALVDVRLRVAVELLAGDVHGATELAVQSRSTSGHALVQAQLKFDLAKEKEEGKIGAQ